MGYSSTTQKQKWAKVPGELKDAMGTWLSLNRVLSQYRFKCPTFLGWVTKGFPLLKNFRIRTTQEPLGPEGQKITFYFQPDLDSIVTALRAPPKEDSATKIPIKKAAVRLGVHWATIYNWRKGIPFDDHRPLSIITETVIRKDGKPGPRNYLATEEVERLEELMKNADPNEAPAHKTQKMLGVCRKTVDNMRDRGELVGIKKEVFRGTLVRTAWHYPIEAIRTAAAKRAEASAASRQAAKTKLENAKTFITTMLSAGPVLATEAVQKTREEGISHVNRRKARKLLHIQLIKPNFAAPRYWALPALTAKKAAELIARGPVDPASKPIESPPEAIAPVKPKRRRGRPKGTIDQSVAERKMKLLKAWDERRFGENKAATGKAFDFDRADATRLINEHDGCRKKFPR